MANVLIPMPISNATPSTKIVQNRDGILIMNLLADRLGLSEDNVEAVPWKS
jgi:hypothetical protein